MNVLIYLCLGLLNDTNTTHRVSSVDEFDIHIARQVYEKKSRESGAECPL